MWHCSLSTTSVQQRWNSHCCSQLTLSQAPKQLNNKYQVTAAANPGSPDSDGGKLLSAVFSPHDEEQLFLVFSREVLIMDLEIHQVL